MSIPTPHGPTNRAGWPQSFPCLPGRLANGCHDFLCKSGGLLIGGDGVELGIGETLRRIISEEPGTSK
jgi:hypothetical protein